MVRAYSVMGLDAMSVGAYDLSLGIDFLLGLSREATFPFLSANLVDPHGRRYFEAYQVRSVGGIRIALVGLLDDDLKRSRIPLVEKIRVLPPLQVAERLVPDIVAKEKPDLVVVLTDMMDRDLRRLALSGLPIDVIVGSSRRNQLSVPARIGSTLVCSLDRGGKTLGRLEVRLTEEGRPAIQNTFVPLMEDRFADHPAVAPLVEETLSRLKELQARAVPEAGAASEQGCGQEFVGAQACRPCHPGRYQYWRATAHAAAYEVLKAKGREFDTDCLACHTVAYECSDGEVDRLSIERFANVQCESCHGPGSVHVASEGKAPLEKGLACPKCHTPERSNDEGVTRRAHEVCADSGAPAGN
ncbi:MULTISPECIES: multiheme c-type cytochrome [Deferrisoma]